MENSLAQAEGGLDTERMWHPSWLAGYRDRMVVYTHTPLPVRGYVTGRGLLLLLPPTLRRRSNSRAAWSICSVSIVLSWMSCVYVICDFKPHFFLTVWNRQKFVFVSLCLCHCNVSVCGMDGCLAVIQKVSICSVSFSLVHNGVPVHFCYIKIHCLSCGSSTMHNNWKKHYTIFL